MKCALCGGEWEEYDQEIWHNSGTGIRCPLAGFVLAGEGQVKAINAAIEAARVDKRRPEECKFYGNNYWDALPLVAMPETELVRCKEGLKKMYCPCAGWEKKQ